MWAMWTNSSRSVCAGDGQGLPFELLQMQGRFFLFLACDKMAREEEGEASAGYALKRDSR